MGLINSSVAIEIAPKSIDHDHDNHAQHAQHAPVNIIQFQSSGAPKNTRDQEAECQVQGHTCVIVTDSDPKIVICCGQTPCTGSANMLK